MKIFVAAAATALLALGALGVGSAASGATPTPAKPAAASGYTPPAIVWHHCSDPTLAEFQAQCSALTVPLDYAHPNGRKIKIAISRKLHTVSAAKYQGVMLVNPGGPGGSGRIYSVLQSAIPDNAGDAYDWIGFDPRGVGASVPSLSCEPGFYGGDRPSYAPLGNSQQRWVARSKKYAALCTKAKGAELFNHVKTTDTVADMESLRKALGKKTISFYGFSYGTYLGSVYATLHPNRINRMVLDSTVDPRNVFYKSNLAQDVAFQKTFTVYLSWLAKYHSVYHVGNTLKAVRKRYLATIAKLDKHAYKNYLGGDELIDVFTNAGYYVYGWEGIATAYARYLRNGNGNALLAMYKDANSTAKGGDNEDAMYLATQCTDASWPRSQHKLNQDSIKYNKKNYFFTYSNAWFNGPCAYWKYPHAKPVTVSGKQVKSHVLMIDETYDPATPYEGSLYVRSIFPTASLIEGKNGTTHAGTLSGVSCTDDAIARYLTDGSVPARKSGNRSDKVCPPVPKPNPTAKSTASSTRSTMPSALRTALESAARR